MVDLDLMMVISWLYLGDILVMGRDVDVRLYAWGWLHSGCILVACVVGL